MGRTYPNEINRILYKPGGDVGKYVRSIAMEIAEESKRLAAAELGINPLDKPRTKKLERSFKVVVHPGTNNFRVFNSVPYFAPIEFGVPDPHEIKARRVQYLQFRGRDGRARRVKMVIHPGNRAYRILGRSVDKVWTRRFGHA